MQLRVPVLLLSSLSLLTPALAKDQKAVLPSYILQAKTVAVVIDPDAGMDVSDPQANRTAQKDVEAALLRWGRFDVVIDSSSADLLLVVRRGNGNAASAKVPDPRQNRRPGVIGATDNSVLIGGQRGRQPNAPGRDDSQSQGRPQPRVEAGGADDSLTVYQGAPRGSQDDPLDAAAGWRYVAKDGLRPHSVPAVDAFRKAVAEAEKAAGKP